MNHTTGGQRNREIIIDQELPNTDQYEDSEGDVLSESKVVENVLVTEQQRSYPSQKHL